MKYTRRGRFLDSADGKWTIVKDLVVGVYTLLNRETHQYVMDGCMLRSWVYLKDVKSYIDRVSENLK